MEARLDYGKLAPDAMRAVCSLGEVHTLQSVALSTRSWDWSRSGRRRSTAAPTASTCIRRTPGRRERRNSESSARAWRETPFYSDRERRRWSDRGRRASAMA